jgi:hypothetical protein
VISIVPAEPAVIYVPSYDPLAVYLDNPYPSHGLITFGIGITIGAWLNSDCDWRGHRVYHHGWRDGGWTGRARPHIRDRRSIYNSSPNAAITINRRVLQRDTARFRQGVQSNTQLRLERAVQPAPRELPGGGIEKRGVSLHPVTSPSTGVRPTNRDLYQGRDLRNGQTAPPSGFGGYGSGKDAKTYRERGQRSRENIPQLNLQQRPAPAERPARVPQLPQVQRTVPQQPVQSQRPAGAGVRQSAPGPARGGDRDRR